MKSVFLVTIPHTGTVFFQELIRRHGIQCERTHTYAEFWSKWDAAAEDPDVVLVTTIRSWDRVRDSWRRRGREKFLQSAKSWERDGWSTHMDLWANLLTLDPMMVSIDCQRDAKLTALSDALGIELKTDWMPANVTDNAITETITRGTYKMGELEKSYET